MPLFFGCLLACFLGVWLSSDMSIQVTLRKIPTVPFIKSTGINCSRHLALSILITDQLFLVLFPQELNSTTKFTNYCVSPLSYCSMKVT